MAFQPVIDTAEIVIEYLGNTVIMKNVLYAEKVGGYSLGDLQLLATTVDLAVGVNWLPVQTSQVSYVKTTARGLAVLNDLEAESVVSAGPGGIVANALPGNVTFSVKQSSGFTGRSARGRLYWIGIADSKLSSNENVLFQSAADDIVAAMTAMRLAIEATVWTPVLVSRVTGGFPRAFGETFGWISESFVNLNVDSQRRRLIR